MVRLTINGKTQDVDADPEALTDGADLVMEIVSDGKRDRDRDLISKRAEYARAGIPEYWLIEPNERRITVLALQDGNYRIHGEFGPGSRATSAALPGFGGGCRVPPFAGLA